MDIKTETMNEIIKGVLDSQIQYWAKELEKRKKDPSFSEFRVSLAERKLKECKKRKKKLSK